MIGVCCEKDGIQVLCRHLLSEPGETVFVFLDGEVREGVCEHWDSP